MAIFHIKTMIFVVYSHPLFSVYPNMQVVLSFIMHKIKIFFAHITFSLI